MVARKYSNIAVETQLVSGISASDPSLIVTSDSGWPAAPFILVIDPDQLTEELILVATKAGTTFSGLTRGFGGTSQQAHNASSTIRHVTVAEDHALIWAHVHTGAGGDDTAKINHDNLDGVSANDHHSQQHTLSGGDHTGQLINAQVPEGAVTQHEAALEILAAQVTDLNHDTLPGVSANDHHNQQHALNGADHTGQVSNAQVPASAVTQHQAALSITESQISDLAHIPDQGYSYGGTNKYESNTSFVKAGFSGLRAVRVRLVGGGGGGGGTSATAQTGGGGGGGGFAERWILVASLAASETVTIGQGGAGGAAGDNDGNAGGQTSFGSLVVATGGGAGGMGSDPNGGNPGAGTTGDLLTTGSPGGGGVTASGSAIGSGMGGSSLLGGGAPGRKPAVSSDGDDALGYGGGGGGGLRNVAGNAAGGDGADGVVLVDLYY